MPKSVHVWKLSHLLIASIYRKVINANKAAKASFHWRSSLLKFVVKFKMVIFCKKNEVNVHRKEKTAAIFFSIQFVHQITVYIFFIIS